MMVIQQEKNARFTCIGKEADANNPEDRKQIASSLELKAMVMIKQAHTADFLRLTRLDQIPGASEIIADAIIAEPSFLFKHQLGLAVKTADCLPVAVVSPSSIAIVHAGWKGLELKILPRVIAAMNLPEGAGSKLSVIFGPAACRQCYEFGDDLLSQIPYGVGHTNKQSVLCLDLIATAKAQISADYPNTEFSTTDQCTICQHVLFHSHRKDQNNKCRNLSVIQLLK